MQKFKLVGPDAVDVPALALVDVTPGTHVEVDDPDVAAGMKGSPLWEHIPDKQRSQAAKKAAATRTDNDAKES